MVSRRMLAIFACLLAVGAASGGEHRFTGAEPVAADNMPVVVAAHASPSTIRSAEFLAEILRRGDKNKFKVIVGNGTEGIALGTPDDFPAIDFHPLFDHTDPVALQGYEIKSHPKGIWVIGASPQALEYAAADLLHRFGYRRYFPSPDWEIQPRQFSFGGHVREIPDYHHRRIWSNFGVAPALRPDTALWERQQRLGGFALNTGHAYETFIRLHRKEFSEHPEYFGLVDGKRTSSKMCISNPELQQLFINYALAAFEKNPELESFSADPSDMQKWCECPECVKLGTPSTRAVFLANAVAEAVNRKYHNKTIGMYAYNYHSPPPDINVHPKMVVSVATTFIRGGFTCEELLRGWEARHAVIGIRDYYDVILWWKDLPGRSAASNRKHVADSIPYYYRMGARYFSSESGDDWGPGGPGYYLAARLLWNTGENPEAVMNDFYVNCFGKAADSAKKIYDLLDGKHKYPLCEDWLGRIYRAMDETRKSASGDEAVMKRLDALSIYIRYAELYYRFEQASSKEKAKAFAELMNFVARNQACRMVHSRGLFREQQRLAPEEFKKNPLPISWDKPEAVTERREIEKYIADGIASWHPLKFSQTGYSDELKLMTLSNAGRKGKLEPVRGVRQFYLWADDSLKPFQLEITGGLISHYRDKGNVRLQLYKIGGFSEEGARETLIQSDDSTPPDGRPHRVMMHPRQPGLHLLKFSDGGDRTAVNWNHDTIVTFSVLSENAPATGGTMFFYVPRGTRNLWFYSTLTRGGMFAPDGKEVLKFKGDRMHFHIPVSDGMDGKSWSLQNVNGTIRLLTVPSYFSFLENQLILPEEVN